MLTRLYCAILTLVSLVYNSTHCKTLHKAYWESTETRDKCNRTIMEHTDALSLYICSALATVLYNSQSISIITHSHQELHIASHSPTPSISPQRCLNGFLEKTQWSHLWYIRQNTKKQESWAGRCSMYVGLTSSIKWILWGTKKNIGQMRRRGTVEFCFISREGMVTGEDGGGFGEEKHRKLGDK